MPQPQVIIRSLLVQTIPGGPRNSKSCDVEFAHAISPKLFTHIFILNKTILATHVLGSVNELGAILKIT